MMKLHCTQTLRITTTLAFATKHIYKSLLEAKSLILNTYSNLLILGWFTLSQVFKPQPRQSFAIYLVPVKVWILLKIPFLKVLPIQLPTTPF